MVQDSYLERVRNYRKYLEGRIDGYRSISDEESLTGSISANSRINVLEDCLNTLKDFFPELK